MKPSRIRQLRQQLELTQAQFAERIGVNQATVSKWESGEINISRLAAKALERIMKEAA